MCWCVEGPAGAAAGTGGGCPGGGASAQAEADADAAAVAAGTAAASGSRVSSREGESSVRVRPVGYIGMYGGLRSRAQLQLLQLPVVWQLHCQHHMTVKLFIGLSIHNKPTVYRQQSNPHPRSSSTGTPCSSPALRAASLTRALSASPHMAGSVRHHSSRSGCGGGCEGPSGWQRCRWARIYLAGGRGGHVQQAVISVSQVNLFRSGSGSDTPSSSP